MKRINHHTVELTDSELPAYGFFEGLLDDGLGIQDAVIETQHGYPDLDSGFYDWLAR